MLTRGREMICFNARDLQKVKNVLCIESITSKNKMYLDKKLL